MKRRKKFLNWLPFVLYLIIIVIFHSSIEANFGDDLYFKELLENRSFLQALNFRYHNWTSRIIIEGFLVVLSKYNVIFWKIGNILILCLLYYSLNKILNRENNLKMKYAIPPLILSYNLWNMRETGWRATSLNYLWPFTLGLYAMIPIINIIREEKINNKILPFHLISLLYAINQEQMCLLIIGFSFLFLLFMKIKNKTFSKLIFLYLILAIISIIYILCCPGNQARIVSETATWFCDFNKLSIFQKLLLGVNNTFTIIIGKINLPYLVFCFFIIMYCYQNTKGKNKKSLILAFMIFIIGCLSSYFQLFKIIKDGKTYMTNKPVIPILTMNTPNFTLSIIISIILSLLIIRVLYLIFKEDKIMRAFVPIIYIAGVLSRLVIGFSPTLYASGIRTGIYFYFSLIIISILIVKKIKDEKHMNKIIIGSYLTVILYYSYTLIG